LSLLRFTSTIEKQYPWHNLNGFDLEKKGGLTTLLSKSFDKITYDMCLKNLANGKTPRPDNIPNSIFKNMPTKFHDLLFLFLNIATSNKKFLLLGKIAKPYYCTKNQIQQSLQTINQKPLQILYTNYLQVLSYYN
jgi:hypothetical protein